MTYFTPYEAAPSLFHIYEPGDVHCTLIVGRERALLFDTGYGFCDIREAVSALTDLYGSFLGKPVIKVASAAYALKTTAQSFMNKKNVNSNNKGE